MRPRPFHACVLLFAVFASCAPLPASAVERTAAELLPQTTVVYAEITQPKQLIETVMNHPLREKIESLEDVQKQLNSQQFKVAQFIVAMIEQKIDMKLEEAVAALTEAGIFLGVDPQTEGIALLIKSRDNQTLRNIAESLVQLGRDDAKRKGEPDPFKTHEYRGLQAFQVGKGVVVQLGPWLAMANKGELAKSIADRFLDGGKSLADAENFLDARKSIRGQPAAWAYADVAALRAAGIAKGLFAEKHDNPAGELLIGGLLSTLQNSPFVTASVYFDSDRLAFNVSLPHDPAWIPERREYYFGPGGNQAAPQPLLPNQTLLTIEAHRDVAAWWLVKEDLYVENVVAKMEQADSQFSTLFAGLDFGQEVLGSLKPGAQIVLVRQNFDELDTPRPDIQLPAGAFVFTLNEPEKIWRRLKVAYQSALAFVNLQLGNNQQPQLEMTTEEVGDAHIISASYLPDEGQEGAINYNFSPSIAFVNGRFIVASTNQLARELVDLAAGQQDGENQATANTNGRLDLRVLHQILTDNHDQLVAQTAIQKGKNKEAAEKEVDTGLDLLSATDALSLRLATDENMLRFDIELTFADTSDE